MLAFLYDALLCFAFVVWAYPCVFHLPLLSCGPCRYTCCYIPKMNALGDLVSSMLNIVGYSYSGHTKLTTRMLPFLWTEFFCFVPDRIVWAQSFSLHHSWSFPSPTRAIIIQQKRPMLSVYSCFSRSYSGALPISLTACASVIRLNMNERVLHVNRHILFALLSSPRFLVFFWQVWKRRRVTSTGFRQAQRNVKVARKGIAIPVLTAHCLSWSPCCSRHFKASSMTPKCQALIIVPRTGSFGSGRGYRCKFGSNHGGANCFDIQHNWIVEF